MFDKILIANRGEIATRIIRSCRELGIETIAVYSEADKESLHVSMADQAYCIGPASPQKSYLNSQAILAVAELSGAQAIHPGYGFLAENANFASMCKEHNIVFIGPTTEQINLMGDKNTAKEVMTKNQIPTVPGSDGLIQSEAHLNELLDQIELPVIIKASAGGGGKGMRVVHERKEALNSYHLAKSEALAFFKNDDVYLEKFVTSPRHIEIQVLGDGQSAIHLGERDCSIQRRHQKLIEEAPSPYLTDELRKKMGAASVKAALAIGYKGAGTIEFLVDDKNNFYFMEMNTRIQVEHPVTEMIYGIDLIKEQIKVAAGIPLAYKQKDIISQGHAIEFRINAENPQNNFMPSPGTIALYLPPGGPGVRVDSHAFQGCKIPANYDSLVGKLIVHAQTREEALAKGKRCMHEFVIDGISTTIPFHQQVLNHPKFIEGDFTTLFLEENKSSLM